MKKSKSVKFVLLAIIAGLSFSCATPAPHMTLEATALKGLANENSWNCETTGNFSAMANGWFWMVWAEGGTTRNLLLLKIANSGADHYGAISGPMKKGRGRMAAYAKGYKCTEEVDLTPEELTTSCKSSHTARACLELASLGIKSGDTQNVVSDINLSCRYGSNLGCKLKAEIDRARKRAGLKLACENKRPKSCLDLATDLSLEQDNESAIKYGQIGCAYGSSGCCSFVQQLTSNKQIDTQKQMSREKMFSDRMMNMFLVGSIERVATQLARPQQVNVNVTKPASNTHCLSETRTGIDGKPYTETNCN